MDGTVGLGTAGGAQSLLVDEPIGTESKGVTVGVFGAGETVDTVSEPPELFDS